MQALETRLTNAQVIAPDALQALASQRRDAMVTELALHNLSSERIRSVDNDAAVSERDEKIYIELGLEAG